MPFDFNSFVGTPFNSFRDSRFNARGQGSLFLAAGFSGPGTGGGITFPSGIIGDSLRFFAGDNFPGALPDFRWGMFTVGDVDDQWGRRSFTIRYWWRFGSNVHYPDVMPFNVFRTAFTSTFFIQNNANQRALDIPNVPVPGATIAHIPTIRFGVFTGAGYETIEHHFFQSPNTSGGSTVGLPTGGVYGPLIEMAEDTWHRTIAWYDEDTLEIGLQLDNLTPETATLTAPIPAGATQGLQAGELTDFSVFDLTFDEYALWHDYVWTSAERLADWNSGTGTGWPDVLSAVSQSPMAYWRFEDPEDNFPEGILSQV